MEKINIYTDGSHVKSKDFIGYGAVCEFEGKEYTMSGNITQQQCKDFYKVDENVSNPTAEMFAAAVVLSSMAWATSPVHIEIIADYIGVKEWNEFKWKANKVYIIALVAFISKCTESILRSGGKVTYRHIPGNQKGDSIDAVMNRKSDVFAKSLDNFNEFHLLVEKIVNKHKIIV